MTSRVFVAFLLGATLCGCVTIPQPESDDTKPGEEPGGDEKPAEPGDGGEGERPSNQDAPPQHLACRFPLTDEPEPVPWSRSDYEGDPLIDYWRKFDCSTADQVYECDADTPCPEPLDHCLLDSADAARGVCVDSVNCAEGVPLSFRDGACSVCADVDSKVALCCAGTKGIDCRGLPFGATSGPGESCFDHADCEPGLVCDNASPESFPVCVCPGVRPEQLSEGQGCGFDTYPKGWGEPWDKLPPLDSSTCRELGSGWSDRLLASELNPIHFSRPARGPDGVNYVAVQGAFSLGIFALRDGTWDQEASFDDGGSKPCLAVDANGAIHFVHSTGLGEFNAQPFGIRHFTNASGAWTKETVAETSSDPVDFGFDETGTPWIVTADFGNYGGGDVITQRGGIWVTEEYAPRDGTYFVAARLVFAGRGTPKIVWEPGDALVAVRGVDGWESTEFSLSERQTAFDCDFARARDGTPWGACDAREHQGSVWVAPFEGDDADADPAFVHEDGRYSAEWTRPSLALDALDRPRVLHRSPQGLTLATRDDTGWKSEVLLPQVPEDARLVLDETGVPHVLYFEPVVHPPEGGVGSLLHVMARGSCPAPEP